MTHTCAARPVGIDAIMSVVSACVYHTSSLCCLQAAQPSRHIRQACKATHAASIMTLDMYELVEFIKQNCAATLY